MRYQANARQLPTGSYESRRPELDLMPIPVATDANETESDTGAPAVNAFLRDAFINDRAIPCTASENVDQRFRRGEDIVEQTHLPKLD